ncbi:ATP-binding protein [Paucibacter sp. XJ19-41]|uniref:ATP-binding protein n=1 Tax=Paucibacter sp. XJ19-41 TaxID=2927824 RepID=UPI00234B6BD0|nr:ATP-binding protein [Paucibacter sp. XJ19-41]MDC6169216.1 ATP-binding protein [Paucibacter sp. XJ19-41]
MPKLLTRLGSFGESSRGASLALLLFVALTLLAIVAQTALAIREDKALTLAAEREHGLTAVRLLQEHAQQILRDAEGNLDILVRAIENERRDRPASDALIREVLGRAQPFNRILTSFQFVNTAGVATVSSIDYPAYQIDADDRGYIAGLLTQPQQAAPVLGRPFARFYDRELILPLARNYSSGDGQYHGVLSTDISVSYFSRFYVHIAKESNAQVALLSGDGRLIARAPLQDEHIGRELSASPNFSRLQAGSGEGFFEGRNFLDADGERRRLYFYKRVDGYPVTALYAREIEDVLAGWRIRSRDRLVFAAAMLGFVSLLSFFLLWHIRRLGASRVLLQRSEAKFANIFHHSPMPLALLRMADDRLLEANKSLLELFGYTAAEFLGKTPRDLGLWADYAQRQPYLERLRADGSLSRYEVDLVSKTGRVMRCLISAQVFESDEGRILIFSPQDISAQREAESRLHQLELQLRETQKMEAIGTLAGGIAHDFNNILAAILGNVGMARQDLPKQNTVRNFLDEIHKAAVRARHLVQQILTFSRRQTQQMHAQPLRPIVEESLGLLRATLPARVALEQRLSDEELCVRADATQLQQVLMNLCTNGWHALSGSTGRLTVGTEHQHLDEAADPRLARLPRGDYAHLWVSDTGVGMSEELLARVFEPFFTTKPVGQGTGLGLAVVHGIVSAHHGGIIVDSQPGQGTCFHLYLPLTEAPAAEVGAESRPAELEAKGHEHVFYLDDDEVMVLMVERLLKRCGYRVSCYQQADVALAALADPTVPADLFITDFNMPEMSGLEVAERVGRLRPQLPVLVSSGYISEELLAGAQRVGVRAVLQKQNTLEELPALIRHTLHDAALH